MFVKLAWYLNFQNTMIVLAIFEVVWFLIKIKEFSIFILKKLKLRSKRPGLYLKIIVDYRILLELTISMELR